MPAISYTTRAALRRQRRAHSKRIARALGVTASGLDHLARAAARPDGQIGGGNAAHKLARQGLGDWFDLLNPSRTGTFDPLGAAARVRINDAGRVLVARARAMGW